MNDTYTDFSDVYKVVEVQFSIMSPDEILQNSVCPVIHYEINESSSMDTPKCSGPNDPRMGPASNNSSIVCPVDENTFKHCPGFFGHIDLAKPVFWPQYMSTIKTVLKLTCYVCSGLLIDQSADNNDRLVFDAAQRVKGRARFEKIKKHVNQKKVCVHCNAPQPTKWRTEHVTKMIAEFKAPDASNGLRSVLFSAERVRGIFARITDDDVEALGFNRHYSRPEWMICTVLPVSPPAIRPSSSRVDSSQRSEDDLTIKLCEIVKYNRELAKKLANEVPYANIDEYIQLLQIHVTNMVNHDVYKGVYKVLRKSGAPIKSILGRFKGKTGRIRGNLMGKRSNFSARSVITGDPTISVEEVGVPYAIARNLTMPEVWFIFCNCCSVVIVDHHRTFPDETLGCSSYYAPERACAGGLRTVGISAAVRRSRSK